MYAFYSDGGIQAAEKLPGLITAQLCSIISGIIFRLTFYLFSRQDRHYETQQEIRLPYY